jgi:hypothetical protein
MPGESFFSRALRRLAHAVVVGLGIVAIIGSGGGALGIPDVDIGAGFPPLPVDPSVGISPSAPTVQAGSIVRFEATVAHATAPITYKWRRSGVDIVGATESTYQLGGAQVGDDGAVFEVIVNAANGMARAAVTLRVSPLAPVVFEDSDFPMSNWTVVTATAVPSPNGPTHAESQATTGGNPGACRLVDNQMTAGTSSLEIVHSFTPAVYEPATQGAIYTIDLAADCSVVNRTVGVTPIGPVLRLTFEQAGRTYQPRPWSAFCGWTTWSQHRYWSVTESTFSIFSGPPCNASERCPDFSGSAAPLRFRLVTQLAVASGSLPGSVVLGIDNWKVTVWRR